jgi:hypothetical protein
MSREIEKLEKLDKVPVRMDQGEVTTAALTPSPGPAGLFTFRYASTEMFTRDGNLHVKMKETRYQDGRLSAEECEGTLNTEAYDRLVSDAHTYFLNQSAGFMRMLLAPLTAFSGRSLRDDD